MEDSDYRRVQSVTHLRAAVMHVEAAMSSDCDTWTPEQISLIRKARDLIRDLREEIDT